MFIEAGFKIRELMSVKEAMVRLWLFIRPVSGPFKETVIYVFPYKLFLLYFPCGHLSWNDNIHHELVSIARIDFTPNAIGMFPPSVLPFMTCLPDPGVCASVFVTT